MDFIVPIGIVIYVIASVIGAVLKMLNSDAPHRQPKPDWGKTVRPVAPQNQPKQVQLAEELEQEVERGSLDQAIETYQIFETDTSSSSERLAEKPSTGGDENSLQVSHNDQAVEEEWVKIAVTHRGSKKLRAQSVLDLTDHRREFLRRGIVLSELLREPRAKRPWPNR